jgi:hypothetical protein
MVRQYSFFIIFFALLTPLAWLSGRTETSTAPNFTLSSGGEPVSGIQSLRSGGLPGLESSAENSQRAELIETLDRLVAYEHYYHSVYGHYTKLVSRLGLPISKELSELYDIRVSEAFQERLVITAFSEVAGRTQDLVSIDQEYAVHASFALPAPRSDYLKSLAFKQLRILRDSPTEPDLVEQGVFKGFFHFEQKLDSEGRKVALAVGVKAPVTGIQLELRAGEEKVAELEIPSATKSPATGEKPVSNVMSTLEEAYLAQRIFHGELGRYAKNWSELSKIASFRFEDKAKFGQAGQVPFGDDAGSVMEIDAASDNESDRNNQTSVRSPSSDIEPIEIEEIYPQPSQKK